MHERQIHLRRFQFTFTWDLPQPRGLNIVPIPIHLQPQLPRLRIYHPPHPIRAPERLMFLQPMPAVHRDPIIPPDPELRQPTVLRLKLDRRDLLERILLRVPLQTNVLDGLLLQVLQKLGAERVAHFVREVESPELLGDYVDGVGFFDGGVLEFLLLLAEWEDAVFGDVGAVAVGGLTVLGHGDHWRSPLV